MFKFSRLCLVLMPLVAMSLLFGCATMRKLDAASILKETKLEFKELTLDSVSINPNLFEKVGDAITKSLVPNPQVVSLVQNLAQGIIDTQLGFANLGVTLRVASLDKDSLWVNRLDASIILDSLMELPLSLKSSYILSPGFTEMALSTRFPLDKRVFKLNEIRSYRIKGALVVSLEADGEPVPLEFDIRHEISPEEMRALEDNVRQSILNGLINDWVGALQ